MNNTFTAEINDIGHIWWMDGRFRRRFKDYVHSEFFNKECYTDKDGKLIDKTIWMVLL